MSPFHFPSFFSMASILVSPVEILYLPCLHAQWLSCVWLFCDPMDCSPPGSSVHGISQARILEWVPFPSPGDLPDPGIKPASLAWQADSLSTEPPGKLSIYHIWEQTSVFCWCGKGDRYLPAQIWGRSQGSKFSIFNTSYHQCLRLWMDLGWKWISSFPLFGFGL